MELNEIIGPDMVLDIQKLQGVDTASLTKYLSQNSKLLIQRINETTKEQILKGEVPGHEPAFAKELVGTKNFPSWYKMLYIRLGYANTRGSSLTYALSIAVYLYECYNLSCSQTILGMEAKTTPPLWAQRWLKQVRRLSTADTIRLYDILDSGTPTRCDTPYVLKSRLEEMAGERGIRPEELILYPGMLSGDLCLLKSFTDATILESGNAYKSISPFVGSNKMLRLIICLCVRHQVSPDYLLLQDYSELITMPDGSSYPLAQRKLLSILLSVDAATRMKAIGFVMAATTRCPNFDSDAECPVEESEQMNIMETYLSGDGLPVPAVEAQIVETLKPQLLRVLRENAYPVSSAMLLNTVDGHARLVRQALLQLEKEGVVQKVSTPRAAVRWQLTDTKQKPKRK